MFVSLVGQTTAETRVLCLQLLILSSVYIVGRILKKKKQFIIHYPPETILCMAVLACGIIVRVTGKGR